MKLILATLLLALLATPLANATTTNADELTITVTGQEPWYPVYHRNQSFTIRAHVEYLGVPQPDATITFTIFNPRGVVDEGDSITSITDENGEMTCTHTFINSAKRGTYTVVIEVEKDGLTGTAAVEIEYLR